MKKTATNETQRHATVIFSGTIKKAYIGKTKFDESEKCRLTLYNPDLDYSQITAYDQQPAKLTPSWFKDAEGYINLNSGFDIPVKDSKGKEISFRDWIDNNDTRNAEALVKIRQKDGAVYPVAIKVLKDGEPVDAFEGM